MITATTWGQHLRLGNYLFKYAAIIAISKKYNIPIKLPEYFLWKYLKNPPEIGNIAPDQVFKTRKWEYTPEEFEYVNNYFMGSRELDTDIDLGCFFQSEKWFENYKTDVLQALEFTPSIIGITQVKYEDALSKPCIGLSIRLGEDFTQSLDFAKIPVQFYTHCLSLLDLDAYNVIIFSDDIGMAKCIFGSNFYYAQANNTYIRVYDSNNYHQDPTEQLVLASLCKHFIIGNSTFSWWMAYLASERNYGKVYHTGLVFDGRYKEMYDTKNYYPERWIKI